MKRFIVVVLALFFASPATAGGCPTLSTKIGLSLHECNDSGSTLLAGEQYTQLRVSASESAGFYTKDSQKSFGSNLLQALGIKKSARSVAVTILVKANGVTYPERPLLVYSYDGSSNRWTVAETGLATFPLSQLGTGSLEIQLGYRYSMDAGFNFKAASDALSTMLPGGLLVNTLSEPFVQAIGEGAQKILSLSNSSSYGHTYDVEMRPIDDWPKRMKFVVTQDNVRFGELTLELLSTPTLSRGGKPTLGLKRDSLRFDLSESASMIRAKTLNGEVVLLEQLKALSQYNGLAKAGPEQAAAVKPFCEAARSRLTNTYGATQMDLSRVMYQALVDAGVADSDHWAAYHACFDQAEQAALVTSLGLTPKATAPVDTRPDPIAGDFWDALGCFMSGKSGPFCSKGGAPRTRLEGYMLDRVTLGRLELQSIKAETLAALPDDRTLARAALLDLLMGKVQRWGCRPDSSNSIIVSAGDGTEAYRILAERKDGKVSGLSVNLVSPELLECMS